MQQTLFPAKDNQSHSGRYRIPQPRGDCRASYSHAKAGDKHIIKHHIQYAARHRTDQRQCRLLTGDHIERKIIHQKNGYGKYQITAQIFHTISFHLRRKMHPGKNIFHQHIPKDAHHHSHKDVHQNQKGKILLRFIPLLLSHLFHNHRASPRGKHGGYGRHKLDDGRRQIDRRERVRTDQIRYKQPVHHGIKRHKHRHRNSGHGKF